MKLLEILKDLKVQASDNKSLTLTNSYWVNYLNAAMSVVDTDKFEKLLSFAKTKLTPKDYSDIAYAWAVKNDANEKSHKIYTDTRDAQLWMKFSDALLFQDHTVIENLIDENVTQLSPSDAANAAKEDGQISLAQSLTYDILNKNDDNQNAYTAHLELTKLRGDEFDSQVSFYNRDPLLQKYVKLHNHTYMPEGWDIFTSLNYYNDSSLNRIALDNLKAETTEADFAAKKRFDRSYLQAHIGYKNFLESYFSYGISAHTQLNADLQADLTLEKNMNVDDTTQLHVAGKKNMIKTNVDWNILHSTSFEFLYEKNYFYSQDNVNIGEGSYAKISLNKQYRSGYPDIGVSVYYDNGIYNEASKSHGIIDKVQNGIFKVLPDNFYNLGMELRYGMANSEIYTRSWRPYFSISPYYNGSTHNFNVGINAGYGGKIWHQDYLNVGASYSQATNGLDSTIFEIFLKYQFLYMHP